MAANFKIDSIFVKTSFPHAKQIIVKMAFSLFLNSSKQTKKAVKWLKATEETTATTTILKGINKRTIYDFMRERKNDVSRMM